jgi:hypothetical protein
MRRESIGFRVMVVAAVLSSSIAVLVSLLWCRSLFVRDYIVVEWSGRSVDLQSYPHHLYVRSLGNVSPLPLLRVAVSHPCPIRAPSVAKILASTRRNRLTAVRNAPHLR